MVTQHDNVLVYKPQHLSDQKGTKKEAMNAGSVIFLKPEIDKSMLQQESEEGGGGTTDSIFQSLNS